MSTDTCPICYDPITKDTGVTTLACTHSYHLGCISRWFSNHESCPCCRSPPTDYEVILSEENENDVIELDEEQRTVIETLLWIQNGSGQPIPMESLRITFDAVTPWPNPEAASFVPSDLATSSLEEQQEMPLPL